MSTCSGVVTHDPAGTRTGAEDSSGYAGADGAERGVIFQAFSPMNSFTCATLAMVFLNSV